MELADTSVWTNRRKDPAVDADFGELVLAGKIASSPPVEMELLWTARSLQEFRKLREGLEALPQVEVRPSAWLRAFDVWETLAGQGRLRQVKRMDLLVAAAAELAGVGLCHYDGDFEVIAGVTGQPVRAIAPLGSL